MKTLCIIWFVIALPYFSIGQGSFNNTPSSEDAVHADSAKIEVRNFNRETLKELKSDESLRYEETPTVAESLWDRFLILLRQFFESLFQGATTTDWGRVFAYVIGIVLLVVVIMLVLRVNAFKIFYSAQGASTMRYDVLDENIHEMDFDKLIQEAIQLHDYRTAIRLQFLHALKILSDKGLIHWEQGKTNHDYLRELTVGEIKAGFNELNFYFEYAWYGNFTINQGMFVRVQDIFANWRARLR